MQNYICAKFQIRVWDDEHCNRCLHFMDQSGVPKIQLYQQQQQQDEDEESQSSQTATEGEERGSSNKSKAKKSADQEMKNQMLTIENICWSGDSKGLAASMDNDINIWNKGKISSVTRIFPPLANSEPKSHLFDNSLPRGIDLLSSCHAQYIIFPLVLVILHL